MFSVQPSITVSMSEPSWLQLAPCKPLVEPAPCKTLMVDWLNPTAGSESVQMSAPCSQASPRKTKVAVAAVAASAAAAAAQAASCLLMETPKKRKVRPSAASAQKMCKGQISEASGAGEARQMAEEHVAEVNLAEKHMVEEQKEQQKSSVQPSMPPRSTRTYAARGTQGTFAGRRPPKNHELLKAFLKDKADYLTKKEQEREMKKATKPKRRYTPEQQQYQAWQRTFDRSQSSSSRARFATAAAAWQVEKARQVAAAASLF